MLGEVHAQRATVEVALVEIAHSRESGLAVNKLDEAKALPLARISVAHKAQVCDQADLLEEASDLFLGRLVADVTDEDSLVPVSGLAVAHVGDTHGRGCVAETASHVPLSAPTSRAGAQTSRTPAGGAHTAA